MHLDIFFVSNIETIVNRSWSSAPVLVQFQSDSSGLNYLPEKKRSASFSGKGGKKRLLLSFKEYTRCNVVHRETIKHIEWQGIHITDTRDGPQSLWS